MLFHALLLLVFQLFNTSATLTYLPSPYNSIRTFAFEFGMDSLSNADMAQAWTFGNLPPTDLTRTSNCASFNLMGGLGILTQSTYLEKTYTNLASHATVSFLITLFTIDNWQSSDFMTLEIDGVTVLTFYPQPYFGLIYGDVCGDPSKDDLYSDLVGEWPHTASTLTLRISVKLSTPPAGWGIYQLQLQFSTSTPSATDSVLKCPANRCQYSSGYECSLYNYLPVGATTCSPCATGCIYCWGPSINQCYTCSSGWSLDGSVCIQCPANCRTCTSPTQCDTCLSSSYVLDTDKVCRFSCSNPSTIIRGTGNRKFCVNRCTGGQSLKMDSTCTSSCTFPFTQISTSQADFCNFLCNDNQYLYPNGTCGTYCNSPYKIKTDLYDNYLLRYCNYPCKISEYLYQDGVCRPDCPQSMVISLYENQIKLCSVATLSPEEMKDIEETASTAKTSGKVSKAGLAFINIASPSNPGTFTAGSLQQMLFYLRYLNISQTPRLETLFVKLGEDSTDFIPMPSMPETFTNSFPSYTLPHMFTKYQLSSNFIVNNGDSLISLLIWAAAFIFVFILDRVNRFLRRIGRYRRIVKRATIILQNYLFGQFYEQFGEIIFFAVLDLRANQFTSERDNLTLWAILLCLVLCVAFLIFYCWIIHRYQALKKSNEEAQFRQFKNKFEGVQLFYEDFVDTSFTSQGFLFFYLMRMIMFYLVVALMTSHPIPQISLLIFLNVLILIYLLYKRPLESKIELVQQISFEFIFMIANITFFVMAITDHTQDNWTTVRKNTSEVVIICNVIFTFLPIAFLALKLIIAAREFYHWMKKHLATKDSRKTRKIAPENSSRLHLESESSRNEKSMASPKTSAVYFKPVSRNTKRRRIRPEPSFESETVQTEISLWKKIDRTQHLNSSMHINIES